MKNENKTSKNPRLWKKQPKQSRSINTVNSILESSRHCFSNKGFQDTRIEDIANHAGVGAASLYDYFPNKTAIAAALVEKVTLTIIDNVRNAFLANTYKTDAFSKGLPVVIRCIYEEYKNNKDVLVDLIYEAPDLRKHNLYSIERLIHQASQIFIRMYWDEIPTEDLSKTHAFINLVFVSSIKGFISTETPEVSEEEFLTEITNLTLSYLTHRDN